MRKRWILLALPVLCLFSCIKEKEESSTEIENAKQDVADIKKDVGELKEQSGDTIVQRAEERIKEKDGLEGTKNQY